LNAYWPLDRNSHIFSPARVVELFHADRSARRVTPKYPSHAKRNTGKRVEVRRRPPADRYTAASYGRAVKRGVERANAARARHRVADERHGPNLPEVRHWHPNQLRHAHGTEVRKRHGLEAAQVVLGHARADVTEVYAERDGTLALRVATEMG
jgi:site-specific recombinase XerC